MARIIKPEALRSGDTIAIVAPASPAPKTALKLGVKRLEEVGCVTVMPLGSPIGSNKGVRTKDAIAIIIENATVPVVVDAGLGSPSHASEAMEMGADAVLVNTAIATAGDPIRMAEAFQIGVRAGREAYLAGMPAEKATAEASSPLTGFLRK